MARLLVADGSSQIYRTFHAMERGAGRRLTAADGTPTGALHSFIMVLRKMIRDHRPDRVAVVFDRSEPTFRHELYPDYKAQREEVPEDLVVQLQLARECLAALRLPLLEIPGWEADDIIATLVKRAREAGDQVVIVSADKDLLQLVGPGVAMHHTVRDAVLDAKGAAEVFGVPAERIGDVLALMGDTSDNIPGVKGIGQKGARELVRHLGSLEDILARVSDIPDDERLGRTRKRMARLLEEGADSARLAKRLVTLSDEAPLPVGLEDLALSEADPEACAELFGRLGFTQLLEELGVEERLRERRLTDADQVGADHRAVTDREGLEALARRLREARRFGLDTETDGRDEHAAKLVGISFSSAAREADYVPVGHARGPSLPLATVREVLGDVLANDAPGKVLQNAKFDLVVLERHGIPVGGLDFDTMIASYLLDPGRRSHSLDSLAMDHLEYRTIPYDAVAGSGEEQVTLDEVDVASVARYAGEDADVALQLAAVLGPRLVEDGLERVFRELELPLVPVLASMETTGVRLDVDFLRKLGADLDVKLRGLEREIHGLAGREFNVTSPKQLGELLFDELGLKPRGRTAKTRARSTAVEVLEQLADEHPLPRLVLEHRELAKLKGTYVDVLPRLVRAETGRVHTTYHQSVAATGRLSSSDPNLQNIPIRTELGRSIRHAFVPGSDQLFVGADYSQVELRVMAHLSGDEALCEAFARGEDIHRSTAARVFGVAPELVTPDLRRRAKEVNFGVLYGMGAHGLAQRLGCRRSEAQEIIRRYFERLPRVRETIDRILDEVRADPRHRARTLFGRARPLPDIESRNRQRRSFAERAAVNAVVQGTAADLIKLAMIELHETLRRECPEARILLQVHDELLVEAPEAKAERVRELVVSAMEGVRPLGEPLRVPLEVVAGIGSSWHELK